MESPLDAPHSSLSYMMGEVNRRFFSRKGEFYVKKGALLHEKLIRDLSGQKNKIILLATAFSLKSFLDEMDRKKIILKLPAGSRLMETGGFKGRVREVSKKALYDLCQKKFGLKKAFCVSEYGMTELSSQCYDTSLRDAVSGLRRKPFKTGPGWMRVTVIDPRTGREARIGQKGLLRVLDLANLDSVMAVQTEDVAVRRKEGFDLAGRAKGSEVRGCSLRYEEFLKDQK